MTTTTPCEGTCRDPAAASAALVRHDFQRFMIAGQSHLLAVRDAGGAPSP